MIFELIGEIIKLIYKAIIFVFEAITAFMVMIVAGMSP
jgi:hypothetical protein